MVIRGTIFSLDKSLFLTVCSIVGTLYFLKELTFDSYLLAPAKHQELVWASIGMFAMSSLFYWILTYDYYYYEIASDKIIVKNRLKLYNRELKLDTLLYINLYGDLSTCKWSSNSLEFVYQTDDSRKNFKYASINYDRDDWVLLIKKLKSLKLKTEDPNKEFFKNSGLKFDDL